MTPSYYQRLVEQLKAFFFDAKDSVAERRWLKVDGSGPQAGLEVYVRKEIKRGEPCLTIADIKCSKSIPLDVITEFIEIAHNLNPWNYTFLETVGNGDIAQWFWEHNWDVVEQPDCMIKQRRHTKLPEAFGTFQGAK